jgi:DNA-binding CsgD family transcriptional regulator
VRSALVPADVAEVGDVHAVLATVTGALRERIGTGPVFLASADPVTAAFTGTFTFDIPDAAAAAFYAIEQTGRDVVSFGSLARAAAPLGSLYVGTAGSPQASTRWREVIEPLGWGDELRAVVRADGATWGYLCLHRESRERPFTARDTARLAALLPAIAGAMRRVALAVTDDANALATGVVLVDARGRVAGTSGGAAAWLDELGHPLPGGLPMLLAEQARRARDTGRTVTGTVTTRTGRMGFVESAPVQGGPEPQVAIVLSAAPAGYQLDRLGAVAGLTAREREVVGCVLDGMSTRAIADRLVISPHTVQAHLTAVFAKTGLRTRRELTSRLRR